MASSSRNIACKDLQERIPRKRMLDVKEFKAVDVVRSIGDRKFDKWTTKSAMDRIDVDFKVFQGLTKLLLSLFKEDGGEEESRCSKVPTSLFAYMIKLKFDDDNFITSKYVQSYNVYLIYKDVVRVLQERFN